MRTILFTTDTPEDVDVIEGVGVFIYPGAVETELTTVAEFGDVITNLETNEALRVMVACPIGETLADGLEAVEAYYNIEEGAKLAFRKKIISRYFSYWSEFRNPLTIFGSSLVG